MQSMYVKYVERDTCIICFECDVQVICDEGDAQVIFLESDIQKTGSRHCTSNAMKVMHR